MSEVTTFQPTQDRPTMNISPTNLTEAIEFSQLLAASDLVPADYKNKPENVLVALQMGVEVGLQPMQALQNIAVINGRPSVWGDAALAIAKAHREFQGISETTTGTGDARVATCIVRRRGEEPVTRQFSVEDAKRATLWNRKGPWQQYPDRMLQMRARGYAIRDSFPDALRGMQLAEVAQDIEPEKEIPADQVVVSPAPQRDTADDTLAAKLSESSADVSATTAEDTDEADSPSGSSPAPDNPGGKASSPFESLAAAIDMIESVDDANAIMSILKDTKLDDEAKAELRDRVSIKVREVTGNA